MNAPGVRLAVVLSHPVQYYSPWFRAMAAQGRDLRVFYLWDFGVNAQRDPGFGTTFTWDTDLLSGYAHEFVPNRSASPGTETFGGLDNPELIKRLILWRPTAVLLFGYRYRTHCSLLLRARGLGMPLIFRGDSHLLGQPRPSFLKRLLLSAIYRRFAAFTYVGKANHDYFRTFGVPESRLHFSPHAVNSAHFDPDSPAVREAAAALRNQLGIDPETRIVLFAGKFVASKQPRALLEAFRQLAAANTVLVFVGDGPEKNDLVTAARSTSPDTVHFLPFANQSEMPARYALADLFVLPSTGVYETWGLAVNEAMHMRVPCLVSDRVGCQRDLVTDGATGWVFRHDAPEHLREKLNEALRVLAEKREPIRAAVAARIAGYSYDQATRGLLAAIRHATAR